MANTQIDPSLHQALAGAFGAKPQPQQPVEPSLWHQLANYFSSPAGEAAAAAPTSQDPNRGKNLAGTATNFFNRMQGQ